MKQKRENWIQFISIWDESQLKMFPKMKIRLLVGAILNLICAIMANTGEVAKTS